MDDLGDAPHVRGGELPRKHLADSRTSLHRALRYLMIHGILVIKHSKPVGIAGVEQLNPTLDKLFRAHVFMVANRARRRSLCAPCGGPWLLCSSPVPALGVARSESGRQTDTPAFTNHQARHWLAQPAPWLLLRADDQEKQHHRPRGCSGDDAEAVVAEVFAGEGIAGA
jgi:hypothetical protein